MSSLNGDNAVNYATAAFGQGIATTLSVLCEALHYLQMGGTWLLHIWLPPLIKKMAR